MKDQLTKIYKIKDKFTEELSSLRHKYIVDTYKGILENKNIREIHRKLYEDTMKSKVHDIKMFSYAYTSARKLKKQVDKMDFGGNIILLSTFLIKYFTKTKLNENLIHIENKIVNENEFEMKEKVIKSFLKKIETESTTNKTDPTCFVMCSKHFDCAKDHLTSQGRLYLDKNYKLYVKDKETLAKIEDFAKKNHIITMQEIVDKPIYMLTRPNCRHYFRQIPLNDVINLSNDGILKKYNLILKIGNRENNNYYYYKYLDRLHLDLALKRVKNNEQLDFLIKKDKNLVKKWKNIVK